MMKKEDKKSGIVSSLIYYLIARFTILSFLNSENAENCKISILVYFCSISGSNLIAIIHYCLYAIVVRLTLIRNVENL